MNRSLVTFIIVLLAGTVSFAEETKQVPSEERTAAPLSAQTGTTLPAQPSAPKASPNVEPASPEPKAMPGATPIKKSEGASPNKNNPTVTVEEVVVTAPRISDPLTVVLDPKAPYQPVPAADGGEFLKSIPGFAVIRKGGIDGDPVLRGSSGSRVTVLLDNELIFGGCGGRMDPPTAYVFPEIYDRLTVLKGPETVMYGPGNSAGVVKFEKISPRLEKPGVKFSGSVMGGSFGRNDEVVNLLGGTEKFYVQGIGTRSRSGDYEDGRGVSVHSRYNRWSENAALGWTPDKDTLLEVSGIKSDGKAAYADRAMDGAKFARENLTLKFEKQRLSALLAKVEAQAYYNYVDHVMDNYSLRSSSSPTSGKLAMNVDHAVTGYRVAATLAMSEQTQVVTGVDSRRDSHRYRDTTFGITDAATATANYLSKAWIEDMRFRQLGGFGELSKYVTPDDRLVTGMRVDYHEADDGRYCRGLPDASGTGCQFPSSRLDNARGMTVRRTLPSGFVRYENVPNRWYVGVGHVERVPDYWELEAGAAPDGVSSDFLGLKPEKTTQLDTGFSWDKGPWSGSVAAFYNRASDYILITWTPNYLARNIETASYGGEGDLGYAFSKNWKSIATVAVVYGENFTDHKPLAQQPAPEGRLALQYDNRVYSFGALWRHAERQNRFDVNSGNIVQNGMDIGPTPGFNVYSINAGWRPTKHGQLTAGVDNIFDTAYAEHLSRTGAPAIGYVVPTGARINEPGRFTWAKLNLNF